MSKSQAFNGFNGTIVSNITNGLNTISEMLSEKTIKITTFKTQLRLYIENENVNKQLTNEQVKTLTENGFVVDLNKDFISLEMTDGKATEVILEKVKPVKQPKAPKIETTVVFTMEGDEDGDFEETIVNEAPAEGDLTWGESPQNEFQEESVEMAA